MSIESIKIILSTTQDGRTKDLRYRQRQFRSLHEWITGHPSEIQSAVQTDDGFSEAEARFLTTLTLNELRKYYDSLDLKAELANEYSIKNGRDNEARRVPEELAYVIPERYAFIFNVFSILYACIAAGSCCVVEVGDATKSHGSSLMPSLPVYSFQMSREPAQVSCSVFFMKL